MPEYQTIVLRHALPEAIKATRSVLEREVLPSYLTKRRWFGMKDQALRSVRITVMSRVPSEDAILLESVGRLLSITTVVRFTVIE